MVATFKRLLSAAGGRIVNPAGERLLDARTGLTPCACCTEPGVPCACCTAFPTPATFLVTLSGVSMSSCIALTAGGSAQVVSGGVDGTYCLAQDPLNPCRWFYEATGLVQANFYTDPLCAVLDVTDDTLVIELICGLDICGFHLLVRSATTRASYYDACHAASCSVPEDTTTNFSACVDQGAPQVLQLGCGGTATTTPGGC